MWIHHGIFRNIYVYINIHTHAITMEDQKIDEFEKDKGRVSGWAWRGERKGKT